MRSSATSCLHTFEKGLTEVSNLNTIQNLVYFNFGLQFTDVLMYANRSTQPTLHFKVHGQMALRDLTVLDSEPRLGAEFCFNLYDGKKAVLLSASTYTEKICWMDDIAEAAQVLRSSIACGVKEFHTSNFKIVVSVSIQKYSQSAPNIEKAIPFTTNRKDFFSPTPSMFV